MKGPRLRIVASCDTCEFLRVTPYKPLVQNGDPNELCRDVECDHPTQMQRYIGERRHDSTPQWCPLLREALTEFTRGNPQHKVNQ